MIEIAVHPRALKHGLTKEEIKFAWNNFIRQRHRQSPRSDQVIAVGTTRAGLAIEMVAVEMSEELLVYHAFAPTTEIILRELGLARR